MSENIEKEFIKFNDFCGLHFLICLVDQIEMALKDWDKLLYEDKLQYEMTIRWQTF